jgi:hypothetical protein
MKNLFNLLTLIFISFLSYSCSEDSPVIVNENSTLINESLSDETGRPGDIRCRKFNAGINILLAWVETELYFCCVERTDFLGNFANYSCAIWGSDVSNAIGTKVKVKIRYNDFKNAQNLGDFDEITIAYSSEYVNDRGEVYKAVPNRYFVEREYDRIIVDLERIR